MYKLLRIGVAPLAVLFFLGLGTTFGQTLKIGFVNSQEVYRKMEEVERNMNH